MPRTYEHTMGSILIRKWVIGAPAVEPEIITPVAVKPYTLKPELTTSEAKAGWQYYPEPVVEDDGIPEPKLRIKKLSPAAQPI